MARYFLPPNGPTTVILDDNRNWDTSWRNHLNRGSAGGVDLVASPGTPVYAPADGTVTLIRWNGSGGHTIRLSQPDGWKDEFMHMREPNPMAVGNGARVSAGDLIGWTGNTANGRVGGVAQHLHWHRINPSGRRENPHNHFQSGGSAGGGTTPIGYGFGLTSDAQRAAQTALSKLGLYDGPADGEFGGKSVAGLQQYLKNVGLLGGDYEVDGEPGENYGKAVQNLAARHGYTGPIDGAPGESTSNGIVAWANSISSPAPAPAPSGGSGGGSSSLESAGYGLSTEAQRKAQEALTRLGLYDGPIDGEFGSKSVSGMQEIMKRDGLLPGDYTVDGVPGPNYGGALQRLAAKFGYSGPIDNEPGEKTSEGIINWANMVTGGSSPAPTPQPDTSTPSPTPPTGSFGIDIATTQRDIDLNRAKSEGVQWVIVKMGGLNVTPQYVAPAYRSQIDKAEAAGLPKGHYYLIGAGQSPEAQADYFVNNLHRFNKDRDVLALDNEKLDDNGVKWGDADAARFIKRVIERTGISPNRVWHYAGASDYRSMKPWTQVEATGARIWWAAYGNGPSGKTPDHEPSLQGAVSKWDVHQFSSSSQIAGYKLDGNYSRLSVSELFATGSTETPAPTPTPTPTPTPEPTPEPEPTPTPDPGTGTPAQPAVGSKGWILGLLGIISTALAALIGYFSGLSQ